MNKIFTDPSATGTTGICMVGSEITFLKFQNTNWKEHFIQIKDLVDKTSASLLVCETATYISNTSSDIRKLIGLVGAIQTLSYFFNLKVETLPSDQVKRLRKKLFSKEVGIAGLEFKKGIGWFYQGNKISVHELDAFLIYWIWKGNNYKSE
jgi:hypothetical protein